MSLLVVNNSITYNSNSLAYAYQMFVNDPSLERLENFYDYVCKIFAGLISEDFVVSSVNIKDFLKFLDNLYNSIDGMIDDDAVKKILFENLTIELNKQLRIKKNDKIVVFLKALIAFVESFDVQKEVGLGSHFSLYIDSFKKLFKSPVIKKGLVKPDQQDAREFLGFLFCSLKQNLNVAAFIQNQIDIAERSYKTQAGVESITPDLKKPPHYYDFISLSVEKIVEASQGYDRSIDYFGQKVFYQAFASLKESIDHYFVKEEIENFYKQIKLDWLPNYLILHLKRFGLNNDGGLCKLDYAVDVPTNLSLNAESYTRKESGTFDYELIGVVMHSGVFGGGHYTALVKWQYPGDNFGQWFFCNDSNISKPYTSLPQQIGGFSVSKNGYLLFYKKKISTKPLTGEIEKNITNLAQDLDALSSLVKA